MSDFSFLERSGAFTPSKFVAEATRAAVAIPPQQVFVQLGESRKSANILRDRYAIPTFELDERIIDDLVIGPVVRNKVVSQSIAPGTVVAKGTAVELVVAPTRNLPGRIIPNGHIALAEETMQGTYDQFIRDDAVLRRVLERTPDASRLSSEDRAVVQERAGRVTFGESPGTTVEDFVRSLHLSLTMVE